MTAVAISAIIVVVLGLVAVAGDRAWGRLMTAAAIIVTALVALNIVAVTSTVRGLASASYSWLNSATGVSIVTVCLAGLAAVRMVEITRSGCLAHWQPTGDRTTDLLIESVLGATVILGLSDAAFVFVLGLLTEQRASMAQPYNVGGVLGGMVAALVASISLRIALWSRSVSQASDPTTGRVDAADPDDDRPLHGPPA